METLDKRCMLIFVEYHQVDFWYAGVIWLSSKGDVPGEVSDPIKPDVRPMKALFPYVSGLCCTRTARDPTARCKCSRTFFSPFDPPHHHFHSHSWLQPRPKMNNHPLSQAVFSTYDYSYLVYLSFNLQSSVLFISTI